MHFYEHMFWEDCNIISLKMVLWKDQRPYICTYAPQLTTNMFFILFISFFDLFIYLFIDYLAPLHMQEFSLVLLLFFEKKTL